MKKRLLIEGPEKRIIWKKDGTEMVLIPAESFEMGDHFNERLARERPVHTVKLASQQDALLVMW